jgi:lactoylglutathione lyase
MKLGYVIIYVDDVVAAIDFYGRAFGLVKRFVDETGRYGELDTGATVLAFAANELAAELLKGGYHRADPKDKPLGMEIALVTGDVPAAVEKAVREGAILIAEPKAKPWGQVVAYVRAPEGTLIEICTPIGG